MTPLFRTVALVLLAYAVSELIYWRWVVPELPRIHHVPLAWWVGVLMPYGLAAIAAGALLSSKHEIVLHSCVAACIPVAAHVAWSVITGTSVAHDTELGDLLRWDPSLWALLLASMAIMAVAFASAIALGHIIAAKRAHAR